MFKIIIDAAGIEFDIAGEEVVHHLHAVEGRSVENGALHLAAAVFGQIGGNQRGTQTPPDQVDLFLAGHAQHLVDIIIEFFGVFIRIEPAVIGKHILCQTVTAQARFRLCHGLDMAAVFDVAVAVQNQIPIQRFNDLIDLVGKDLPVSRNAGKIIRQNERVAVILLRHHGCQRLRQRIELMLFHHRVVVIGREPAVIDVGKLARDINDGQIDLIARSAGDQ